MMLGYLNSFKLVGNTVGSLIGKATLLWHIAMLAEDAYPGA
jgi:hypothetical protein